MYRNIDEMSIDELTEDLMSLTVSMAVRLDCLEEDPHSVKMIGFREHVSWLEESLDKVKVILGGGDRHIECYTEIDDPIRPLFDAYIFGYFVQARLPVEYKQLKAAYTYPVAEQSM